MITPAAAIDVLACREIRHSGVVLVVHGTAAFRAKVTGPPSAGAVSTMALGD